MTFFILAHPIFSSRQYHVKISEKTPINADIYQFNATVSTNNPITYSYNATALPSAPAEFTVSTAGIVKYVGPSLDYNKKSSYVLMVQAADSVTNAAAETAQLTVELMNEDDITGLFPTSPVAVSLSESSTVGTLVTQVTQNTNLAVTYYILKNHYSDKFAINSTSGELTLATTIDYEGGTTKFYITVCANATEKTGK